MSLLKAEKVHVVTKISKLLNITFIWTLLVFIGLFVLLGIIATNDFLHTGVVERVVQWWYEPVFDSEIWIGIFLSYNQIALVIISELVANYADRTKFNKSNSGYFTKYSLTVIGLSTINACILGYLIFT